MKFFGNPSKSANETVIDTAIGDAPPPADGEKQINAVDMDSNREKHMHVADGNVDAERPSEDAQNGVKKVEAVTLTWTKKELYFAYFW